MRTLVLLLSSVLLLSFAWGQTPRKAGVEGTTASGQGSTFKSIYALVIGISDYKNDDRVKDLDYADDDAKLFYQYLLEAYPTQIKPGENVQLLLDKSATQSTIDEKLRWLKSKAAEDVLIIFYFAGHGGTDSELGGLPGYLLAYDASPPALSGGGAYSIELLDRILNNDIAGDRKATVISILDACHSGKSTAMQNVNADVLHKKTNIKPNSGRVIKLLSSRGSEDSNERPELCNGHGVFTYYLIKGLLKEADESDYADRNGRINVAEIDDYLRRSVKKATGDKQLPEVLFDDKAMEISIRQGNVTEDFRCFFDGPVQTSPVPSVARVVYDEQKLIEDQLNETQRRHYGQFTEALKAERYLEPARNNAREYYATLELDGIKPDLLAQIQSQWKAKFQDYGQNLIVQYLQESALLPPAPYEQAGKMLKYCLDFSSLGEAGYNLLKAKQIWLTSYALSRKLASGVLKISQNESRQIRLTQIIPALREAIRLDPNAAYLQNTLGFNLERLSDEKGAEAAYREAIRLAPRWTYPRNNLANVVANMDEKIRTLNECITLNPNMYLAYGSLSAKYRVLKDTLKCRQYLDKALQLCPKEDVDDLAWIYQQYGYLYQQRQLPDRAEYYFKKSIDTSKDETSNRIDLINHYCDNANYQQAATELDQLERVNPSDAQVYATRGYRSFRQRDYKEAERWYRKSLTFDSLATWSRYFISIIYRQLDRYPEAEKETRICLRVDPNEETFWAELGTIYSDQKKFDQALNAFKKCLEINPQSHFSYFSLGYVYLRQENYTEAERIFRKAIELSPNESADYRRILGQTLSYQKRYPEAMNEYRKVLRLNPADQDVRLNIADLYVSLDKPDSVAFYAEQGLIENPLVKTKEYAQARKQFTQQLQSTKLSYFALGYMNEKGYELTPNPAQARKWYQYADQMYYPAATQRLINLYESGRLKISQRETALEVERLKKNEKTKRKKFTIPCLLADGTKLPIDLIIEEYPHNEDAPIQHEVDRIREIYGANVPADVVDSFNKLFALARKNKVSFTDLCVYAFDAANEEKGKLNGRAINYPAKALAAIHDNHLDSLNYFMAKASTTFIGVNLQKPDEAARILLDSLRRGTDHNGLLYYALGYLYENKQTGREWSKAEKWYTYSFQIGYAPAYFRLLNRYRQLSSTSAATWITDNYNRGTKGYDVKCKLPDGSEASYVLYVQDFPLNPANPIEQESQRLLDVFGATPTELVKTTFVSIYTESLAKKQSFIETCKLLLSTKSSSRSESDRAKTESEQYVEKGDALYDKKDYKEAATFYQKGIEKATDTGERSWAYLRLGDSHFMLDQQELAIQSYLSSISIKPQGRAYFGLGYVYRSQKNLPKAIEAFKNAIELRPTESSYLRSLAETYYDNKSYEEAVRVYKRSLDIDAGNSNALTKLSIALITLGHYDESIGYLNKAIEINPSQTALFYFYQSFAYKQAKQFAKAIELAQKAVSLQPQNADFQESLASAYNQAKQYEQAATAYKKALDLESKRLDALNGLGISLTYLKKYDEGLGNFRKGIEIAPDKAGVFYYNIACNYALQNKIPQALENLEIAVNKYKYGESEEIRNDPDFAGIRNSDSFKNLLAKYFPRKP